MEDYLTQNVWWPQSKMEENQKWRWLKSKTIKNEDDKKYEDDQKLIWIEIIAKNSKDQQWSRPY